MLNFQAQRLKVHVLVMSSQCIADYFNEHLFIPSSNGVEMLFFSCLTLYETESLVRQNL